MAAIYPFSLDFSSGKGQFASFPFIMNDSPIAGISCLVSSRISGDMVCFEQSGNVNPNRLRLFEALDLEAGRVAFLKQVHSRKTVEVDSGNLRLGTEADGLITTDRDLSLSVTVADCLPVYLYDSESGGFGVLHSGWKGTGIVLSALELMKEKGTQPKAVAAVLGPCIRSCCYRVDKERAAAFEKEFGETSCLVAHDVPWPLGPVTVCREDGYYLDMQAANVRLLAGAGVRNIAVCTDCTFTDERLGSFRREGSSFTHMIAMAGYFKNC